MFTLVAVGDCLIGRRVSTVEDPDFLALAELLRGADCAWGNCEVVLADPRTVYRAAKLPMTTDPHVLCAPWGADELRFLGLDLLSTANNHTMDFGDAGLASTLANLERAGIVHAGAGSDLVEAARPGYLRTAAGGVALVGCASSYLDHYAAGPPHSILKGRPGLNPLYLQTTIELERSLFERLEQAQAEIGSLLGWNEYSEILQARKERRPAGTALFFETLIRASDKVEVRSQPRSADVARILESIQAARPEARVVIASIHTHEARGRLEEPDPFLPPFARACLDAGADVFLATGPHVPRGLEIHRGKPIFYSLGNFLAHLKGPAVTSEGSDLHEQRRFWETFVPRIAFADSGEVAAIDLHPVTLGFGDPSSTRGTPRLARGEEARSILTRLAELSFRFGTEVELDGEVGRVRLRHP